MKLINCRAMVAVWLGAALFINAVCVYAQRSEGSSAAEVSDSCRRSGIEVDLSSMLYQTAISSSILVALLSDNVEKAIEQVGGDLATNVVTLNLLLKENPCKVERKKLDRIYPILRVVAAVNAKTPIPAFVGRVDIQEILTQAIANDPKHYASLLKRSESWRDGVK